MSWAKVLLVVGLTMATNCALATESLSCRIQQDLAAGAGKVPMTTEFVWSTAHNSSAPSSAVKTSIGKIDQGEALGSVLLDGQPVQLPATTRGVIRFGKVFDYGDRVVLAYRVEREWDSTASPSEVVYALDKRRTISDVDILPGNEAQTSGHCILID